MRTSRLTAILLSILGCATASSPAPPKEKIRLKLGVAWVAMRAGQLGLSQDEARDRDDHLTSDEAPESHFWDADTAKHTAAVWRTLCQECHGGARSISSAEQIAAPDPDWGSGETNLFGRNRAFAEAYQIVFAGSEDKRKMPAWGGKLAREQIWALLRYIEHLSNDATTSVTLEKKP